ncbi:MAG: PmeII family type II restriction endonuclease [Thermodesulfobacteriota bacterium]
MKQLKLNDVTKYVEDNIGIFHQKRIERLDKLSLKVVLRKKNPYLFKAKHLLTASEIVKCIADAFISSNEETIFGDWLEGLAIFINQKVYDGWKSGVSNIDLEFDKDNVRYIVNIKSGPNWGNSSQISKMKTDFNTAKKTLRTSNSKLIVISINGCCYGIDNKPDKGDYFKYCGQEFWHFISGQENLYKDIIKPLGHKAKEKNEEFIASYSRMLNKFTKEFIQDFCKYTGEIDWNKLVEFNSRKNNRN